MIFIIDANILFSALIKPSGPIALLIFGEPSLNLIAPAFIEKEFYKHRTKLSKITKKPEEELIIDFEKVLKRITLYTEGIITENILTYAENLVADIDPNDFIYVAFALFFNAKLWSGDKVLTEGLKAKGIDIVATTFDVAIAIMK